MANDQIAEIMLAASVTDLIDERMQLRPECARRSEEGSGLPSNATGEYHRQVQRACKQAGFDTRLVHPLTSKQFRMPADPANKTDDTDLAAIFRAAVNGFGLLEPVLSEDHLQLQLLIRHRRDLVAKTRPCVVRSASCFMR